MFYRLMGDQVFDSCGEGGAVLHRVLLSVVLSYGLPHMR